MPTRSCIACRKRESWEDLLHVVVIDGQVTPDPDHRLYGRGAWLHLTCFEMAKQRRAFARAFPAESEVKLDELEKFIASLIKLD